MKIADYAVNDAAFLGVLAELLIQAGKDRAADAIYAAIESETIALPCRPTLTLVHSAGSAETG